MMNIEAHIWIVVFWVLFGVWHSLFAAPGVKKWAEKKMGRYYSWYRPLYSIIAFIQTGLILTYQFFVEPVYLWKGNYVFIVTALAGLAVMGLSVKKYFYNLSGIQVLYNKKEAPVLETSGMHEYVRHPLYGATLLFAWSIFLIFPVLSYLLTCISMTAYTLVGMQLEEKKLEQLFGQQYKDYKVNVPQIIPFTRKIRKEKSEIRI